MKLRSLATAALGLGLAMAVPAVAQAYTSYTTDSVNFRAGPGVGYRSYGALPAGTPVDVHYCQPGWCRASSFLGTGWVSSRYLDAARRVYPRPLLPAAYYPRAIPITGRTAFYPLSLLPPLSAFGLQLLFPRGRSRRVERDRVARRMPLETKGAAGERLPFSFAVGSSSTCRDDARRRSPRRVAATHLKSFGSFSFGSFSFGRVSLLHRLGDRRLRAPPT